MLLNRLHIISVFALFLIIKSEASHIIGGEMSMEHVLSSRYELSLKLFYDVKDGQDIVEDTIIVSSFRKGNHQKIENYVMVRNSNYENADLTNSLCNEGLNIRIYTYKSVVFIEESLYDAAGGYYFSWQRCCRANGISNISNSGSTGFVFYFEFPSSKDFPANSSPKFNSVSGDYYCVGQEVQIDFSARDSDNDNLVYSLVRPKAGFSRPDDNVIIGQAGPYPEVDGYFDISSVAGLQIDANGLLSFTPAQAGYFTIAVLCEEYRNGEKIGSVIRDIVVLIRNCEENSAPAISFFPYGNEIEYVPGDTVFIRNQNELCHVIKSYDSNFNNPDGEENFLNIDLLGFDVQSPEIRKIEGAPMPEWEMCLIDCQNPQINFFKLRLTVSDDHCPIPFESFVDVNFKIIESEDIPPVISTNYIPFGHSLEEEIRFQINVSDPDSSGINVFFSGEGFNPESLDMNFGFQMDNCCNAKGEFLWIPLCSNILDKEDYKLYFTAQGENCGIVGKDSLSVNLFVENPGGVVPNDLSFPNVITPNGDGLNDSFYFPVLDENLCLEQSFERIRVYNRWGREVYNSNESTFSWDASNVTSGHYFYEVKFKNKAFKGFLHILK